MRESVAASFRIAGIDNKSLVVPHVLITSLYGKIKDSILRERKSQHGRWREKTRLCIQLGLKFHRFGSLRGPEDLDHSGRKRCWARRMLVRVFFRNLQNRLQKLVAPFEQEEEKDERRRKGKRVFLLILN